MPRSEEGRSPLVTYGNITDVVSAQIREMILDGQLEPGQWIRQAELASTLGVSTMPVREALRQLQAEGLVLFQPRRGAMVAQVSLAEFEEVDCISEALEMLACKWVAEDFGRIPLDHMRQVLSDLEDAQARHDEAARVALVREFHFIIYEAAGRAHLVRVLSSLFDMTVAYRRVLGEAPGLQAARIDVYRACEAQDLQALLCAMRELYALARHDLRSRLCGTG